MQITVFELPQHAAWMILGLSSTRSPFGPLPLDLSSIGMPGCSLRVGLDDTIALSGAHHQAILTLPIPNSLALLGGVVHLQALVPDPSAGNVLGAVMSDAMTMMIGR
jgi:hypothetical protein